MLILFDFLMILRYVKNVDLMSLDGVVGMIPYVLNLEIFVLVFSGCCRRRSRMILLGWD